MRNKAAAGGEGLVVEASTQRGLRDLLARCGRLPPLDKRKSGLHALFSGPSGTGKHAAARILASDLGMDIYLVKLGAIQNKYQGETERRLAKMLAQAEHKAVVLLFDEADSLLGRRSEGSARSVAEFVLRRLSFYRGVAVVLTDSESPLSSELSRRMDWVVDFRAPDAGLRYRIWNLHLGAEHGVDARFLEHVARRCEFTGGQIRSAADQAELLAREEGSPILRAHVIAAVRRQNG